MRKFRKKPIIVEAIQNTGGNKLEINAFVGKKLEHGKFTCDDTGNNGFPLVISTLEGDMVCSVGDWVIKGIKGEFYPCKPDIFEQTYEEVKL